MVKITKFGVIPEVQNFSMCSRIAALSFANKGRKLCAISTDGTTCEMNSETGELLKEMKISKKLISSSVYFSGESSQHMVLKLS